MEDERNKSPWEQDDRFQVILRELGTKYAQALTPSEINNRARAEFYIKYPDDAKNYGISLDKQDDFYPAKDKSDK